MNDLIQKLKDLRERCLEARVSCDAEIDAAIDEILVYSYSLYIHPAQGSDGLPDRV